MSSDEDKNERAHRSHRFYDVEYHMEKIRRTGKKPLGRVRMMGRRVMNVLDATQRFLSLFMGPAVIVSMLFVVIIGHYYGPIAFLLIVGGSIGALTILVERKMGGSLQFGEYKLGTKILAQTIAFLALAGIFYLLLFLL